MTRTTRRMPRVAAVVPALAVAAALLAGCGSPSQAGSAAVVGDRRITEADLQTATRELQQVVGSDNPLTQADVLSWLITAQFTIEEAARDGLGVSPDDARIPVQRAVPNASDVTLVAAQSAIARSRLYRALPPAQSAEALARVKAQVKKADIQINPRYGSALDTESDDPNKALGVLPASLDWLVKDATPTAQPDATTDPNAPATTP